jgi:hypothetical protein
MKFEGSIDFFELKIKELHVNLMGNLQNIKQTMGMLSRMIYKGGAGRNMPLPKIIWAFPTIQYTIKLTILRSAPTIVALRGLILAFSVSQLLPSFLRSLLLATTENKKNSTDQKINIYFQNSFVPKKLRN